MRAYVKIVPCAPTAVRRGESVGWVGDLAVYCDEEVCYASRRFDRLTSDCPNDNVN
jgi:hypothetical protein